jgi:threonine dehydrogenase-like Zn-dependent dehydrogenase
LSCAIHAINRGDISMNDVVVVAGCGAIGCAAVAAAKQKSPMTLIAIDLFDFKLEVAKACGADYVLNPKTTDVDKSVEIGRRLSISWGRAYAKYLLRISAFSTAERSEDVLHIFTETSLFKDLLQPRVAREVCEGPD